MAGIVGNERQLTGIIDLDDGIQASSSAGRLSTLDSNAYSDIPDSSPESRPWHERRNCVAAQARAWRQTRLFMSK
jgi:hypothetical protein